MKKKILLSVLASLIVLSAFGIGAYAAVKYSVMINGKAVKADVKVINGKTYIPLDSLKGLKNITINHDAKKGILKIEDKKSSGTPSATTSANTVDYKNRISEPTTFNYNVNSADGVTLTFQANYLGSKTINYITYRVSTFNAVGDPSFDDMSGKSKFELKYVGPLKTGEQMTVFQIFTYQGALHTIVVDEILLQYSDGTKETLKCGFKTSDSGGLAE